MRFNSVLISVLGLPFVWGQMLEQCPGFSRQCYTHKEECRVDEVTGGATCVCKSGYKREACDLEVCACIDIDECSEASPEYPFGNPCVDGAYCVNYDPPERFKCECLPGYNSTLESSRIPLSEPVPYSWRPLSCTNINECELSNPCDPVNGVCTDTVGGVSCACVEGFVGDGVTCIAEPEVTPVDPCVAADCKAASGQECVVLETGGATCICSNGYTPTLAGMAPGANDGRFGCRDVNECEEGINANGTPACAMYANCQNYDGFYFCSCKTGFEGNALESCTLINPTPAPTPMPTTAAPVTPAPLPPPTPQPTSQPTQCIGDIYGPADAAFIEQSNSRIGLKKKSLTKRSNERPRPRPRIVGGEAAGPDFPWFAQWEDDSGLFCGGSLIHPRIILSAAHCNFPGFIRVNSTDISSGGITLNIKRRVVHPDYVERSSTLDNDYLLILLDEAVTAVTPVALNNDASQPEDDEDLTVIGFGATSEGGLLSDNLLKVAVPVVPQETCTTQYVGLEEDIHLCAGFAEGGRDSCQGDSGGPIFEFRGETPIQVGVVSFGDGCARPNLSGVYARVSSAYDWIQQTVCDLTCDCSPGLTPGSIAKPTPAPTPPFEGTNNECNNATQVIDGASEFGSTIAASVNSDSPVCNFATTITAGGVWYSIVGTGDMIVADTCGFGTDFDTKLSVYTGQCDALECVGGNDDTIDGLCSSVTWESINGVEYTILVHGYNGRVGNFELSVNSIEAPTFEGTNNECTDATQVIDGSSEVGSTIAASVNSDSPLCDFNGFAEGVTAGGVWYSLLGTGDTIVADTCGFETDFDTKLSVYTGQCDALECVGESDVIDFGLCTSITWESIDGVEYNILVHGDGASVGNFELSVISIETPTFEGTNNECTDATQVIDGTIEFGSTIAASVNSDSPVCSSTTITAGGVWYSIVGTGDTIVADTCGFETDFDTKLSVYTGQCDALECVGESDVIDFGLCTSITWESIDGVEYNILVHGFGASVGNFELSINSFETPTFEGTNNECTDATQVVDGASEFGSTIAASVNSDSPMCEFNGAITAGSVWYSVVGTGDMIVADTCGVTDFDTKLSVYTGQCDALECIGGNDDTIDGLCSSVTWESINGVEYTILVHGYDASVGNFELTVTAS